MAKTYRQSKNEVQRVLFTPESSWQLPDMATLPSWSGASRIGIDVEAKDPKLKELGPGIRRDGSRMVGVSFAIEDGPAYYLPISHATGQNLDSVMVLKYIRDQMKNFTGILVGANMSYDIDWLMEHGIDFSSVSEFRDVQIADPIIYELHYKYSLQAIAARWEIAGKDEELLREAASLYGIHEKTEMWKLDPRFVGAYGEHDARLPLQILRRQERVIDEEDLWNVFKLECQLLPVLVKMRRRGVKIDFDRLAQVEQFSIQQEAEYRRVVYEKTGVRLGTEDLSNANALLPAVLATGAQPAWNSNGTPNIDKHFLAGMGNEVGDAINRARKVLKLRRDFAGSVRDHATNGRIHCTFNQVKRQKEGDSDTSDTGGASYGRLSSEHPNLQQQPSRDDFAQMWRSIYVADPGGIWACNDYSGQEPRFGIHFAAMSGLAGACEAAQKLTDNPDLDVYKPLADEVGIERKPFKEIYLGISYGMGGPKLCDSLGYPTTTKEWKGKTIRVAGPEGQAVFDKFDAAVPFVRKLAKSAQYWAEKRGWVKTIAGRKCHFPKRDDGTYDWTHKALNRVIQGSSADQTKKAMVEADAQGFALQLQVHDELDLTVADRREAERLAEIMRDTYKLKVPVRVDVETGPNWGDIS